MRTSARALRCERLEERCHYGSLYVCKCAASSVLCLYVCKRAASEGTCLNLRPPPQVSDTLVPLQISKPQISSTKVLEKVVERERRAPPPPPGRRRRRERRAPPPPPPPPPAAAGVCQLQLLKHLSESSIKIDIVTDLAGASGGCFASSPAPHLSSSPPSSTSSPPSPSQLMSLRAFSVCCSSGVSVFLCE